MALLCTVIHTKSVYKTSKKNLLKNHGLMLNPLGITHCSRPS